MNMNDIVAAADHARVIAKWAAEAPVITAGDPARFNAATKNVVETGRRYSEALFELTAAAQDLELQLTKLMKRGIHD